MRNRGTWSLGGLVLLLVSCASSAGTWPAAENKFPVLVDDLKQDVRRSLGQQGWESLPARPPYAQGWYRRDGAHQTRLYLGFEEIEGAGAMSMMAQSHHTLNWLTIGILGKTRAGVSRQIVDEWLASFKRAIAKQNPQP